MKHQATLEEIENKINIIRQTQDPHNIADIRLDLAGYKSWLGARLVEAKFAYNIKLNKIMEERKCPVNQATIKAETTKEYFGYARIQQLYNDTKTVISTAGVKIETLKDERYQ